MQDMQGMLYTLDIASTLLYCRVNTRDSGQELVPLTNKGKRITALALNPTKAL